MALSAPPLRIATRKSRLALAQAEEVRARLLAAHPALAERGVELLPLSTTGDREQKIALAEIGGKGLFTKEIEEALLGGAASLAAHSYKDMPTLHPPGLIIGAVLPREDARDVLIGAETLESLPQGARLGTSSLRRAAQALRIRPDLRIVPLRGNVETRLRKIATGEAEATLLAMAGLKRLNFNPIPGAPLPVEAMLPAVAQGAIAVQCRADDRETIALLSALNDPATERATACERALLAVLEGSCRTPIAAYATVSKEKIHLRALVLSPDGSAFHEFSGEAAPSRAEALGEEGGRQLRASTASG